MRVQAAVAAFVLLAFAGCSSPGPSAATAGPPRWITLDPVVLAEGAFEWHETGTGNALEYYELASQAVAHPCVWENPNGSEEVYFNNLRLPTGRASQGLGAWPGNLSLALDWTDQDWVGTALRIAYQAHGVEGWQETAPIERGTTLTVPIRVAAGNASADGEETEPAQGWSVWVCLPTDTGDPESPFMGSVQARVAFAPDPVLESELA
ncbi:MAG TPA: hypothetical protein VJ874_05855, partial [Candidatus Thermoplasmatota archaeon]|nr:hypothetical protein [Candidatus Thermoplasmatota archaeon]